MAQPCAVLFSNQYYIGKGGGFWIRVGVKQGAGPDIPSREARPDARAAGPDIPSREARLDARAVGPDIPARAAEARPAEDIEDIPAHPDARGAEYIPSRDAQPRAIPQPDPDARGAADIPSPASPLNAARELRRWRNLEPAAKKAVNLKKKPAAKKAASLILKKPAAKKAANLRNRKPAAQGQ